MFSHWMFCHYGWVESLNWSLNASIPFLLVLLGSNVIRHILMIIFHTWSPRAWAFRVFETISNSWSLLMLAPSIKIMVEVYLIIICILPKIALLISWTPSLFGIRLGLRLDCSLNPLVSTQPNKTTISTLKHHNTIISLSIDDTNVI